MFIVSYQLLTRALLILMQIGAMGSTITYKELAIMLGLPTTRLN